jgi:inositol 1,4,5-triphosphate receptor type 3
MAELFRDNYNVLFNLDPYCDENAVIGKLFKKFEYNFSEKNYEGCIYFLQLVPYLVRIKQNEILQNNEIIVQMFKKSKLGIHLKVQALLKKAYECKVESNTRGFDATPHSPARGRTNETLGTIEMPVDICFLTEFLGLVRMIGSRSSPTVDEFTKLLMPITLIQESLTNLDEWYPLKL